jgi:hypothetical protein
MKDMIRLVILAIALSIVLPLVGQAATVTLAWDASLSAGVQGYAVYDKNYQKPYNYNVAACTVVGAILTCNVVVPDDRQTAFVARAFAYGPYDLSGNRIMIWSGDSNEAVYIPAVTPPTPPRNLLSRFLIALGNFLRGLFG